MNKVSPNRQKKEKIVAKLSEKATRAKGLVFTNYQGLTHVQLEKLKKALREANAELVVTKNTLLKLSLEQTQNSILRQAQDKTQNYETLSVFQNPTATLFIFDDPIEPLKQLAKTIKELNLPTVKLGIIDGKNLTSEQVLTLAALPPYNVLIGRLLFQMKAPLYRLHHALNWNLQRFILTLNAIQKTKAG